MNENAGRRRNPHVLNVPPVSRRPTRPAMKPITRSRPDARTSRLRESSKSNRERKRHEALGSIRTSETSYTVIQSVSLDGYGSANRRPCITISGVAGRGLLLSTQRTVCLPAARTAPDPSAGSLRCACRGSELGCGCGAGVHVRHTLPPYPGQFVESGLVDLAVDAAWPGRRPGRRPVERG